MHPVHQWRSKKVLVATTFMTCAVILGAVFSGIYLLTTHATRAAAPIADAASNPITLENANPGSSGWQVVNGHMAYNQIQAYVSARSLAPGQKLSLYVSTQQAGTGYKIQIYRLGWYKGKGGRLMKTVSNLIGKAQGYFDFNTSTLVNCTTCYIDTTTGLIEARWQPSYTFTIPSTWTTGIYLVKFIDANNMQTYASFELTGNTTAPYAVVTADTTYAAYNNWGGRSLYDYNSSPARAAKVSFARPSTQNYGSDQVLVFELDALRWMERKGYNLSYMSSIDLHTNPASLLQHTAYIALGHDEYWSKEMRDGVEAARDAGVGMAFLEADDAYWQIRFEPSSAGVANQTLVSYKVSTYNNDLSRDPYYGKDNSRVTSQWRDAVINRPENELIGVMFSDLTHQQNGFAWTVDPNTHSSLLAYTKLVAGQSYGCGLVGYEWDKVFDNGVSPAGLQVIGTTPTTNDSGQSDSSNTTSYIASSGAMVFATGGIYWTRALDNYRFEPDTHCSGQPTIVAGMQNLMAHVMKQITVLH